MNGIHKAAAGLLDAERLPWLLLALATPVVFFVGIAERQVYGTAAFYAAISREVAETGVWTPLQHGGVPYVYKPPLQFWLSALGIGLLGPSNAAVTFLPRLFGSASVLLTAWIGRRLYGPAAGFFAGLTVLLNVTLIENSNTFRHDPALLLGMLTAFAAYLAPAGRWRPPVFYLGVCFAVLSKGPPGLLPLGLVPLHAWWSGRLVSPGRPEARPWLAWSWLLLLPVLWYADQYRRLGDWFLERLASDAMYDETGSLREQLGDLVLVYLFRPIVGWLPFSLFMLWGLGRTGRRVLRGAERGRDAAADRTLLVWVLLVLALLVVRQSHRVRYMLMLLPPLAWLGGREMARLAGGRVPLALSGGLACILALALLGLAVVRPSFDRSDGMGGVAIMRRLFDRELGGPAAPVPVLLPDAVEIGGYGGQQSIRDWIYFYLGRRVRLVHASELARTPPGSLFFVYWDHIEELERAHPLRVLVETKRTYLVELTPPRNS